jgi:hypothetical protein
MPAYRAYFLDPDDHIIGTEVITVATLGAAVDTALGLLKGLPGDQSVELWEGEKRRCSLPPSTYRRRALTQATGGSGFERFAARRDLNAIVSRLTAALEYLDPVEMIETIRQPKMARM